MNNNNAGTQDDMKFTMKFKRIDAAMRKDAGAGAQAGINMRSWRMPTSSSCISSLWKANKVCPPTPHPQPSNKQQALSIKHATRNTQHATRNTQHATRNTNCVLNHKQTVDIRSYSEEAVHELEAWIVRGTHLSSLLFASLLISFLVSLLILNRN